MTEYLPRSWWADPSWARGGAQMVDDDIHRQGNVLHYPGRSAPFGVMTEVELRNNLRGWWDWHVNGRGWSDLAYNAGVDQAGRVIDLRGIGRVPAAHASPSNPNANWHGGATLLILGNTEDPSPEMIQAYRDFRHTAWLPRWPTATKVTGHRLVPGAQTSCPGDEVVQLIQDDQWNQPPEEADMPYSDWPEADKNALARDVAVTVWNTVNSVTGDTHSKLVRLGGGPIQGHDAPITPARALELLYHWLSGSDQVEHPTNEGVTNSIRYALGVLRRQASINRGLNEQILSAVLAAANEGRSMSAEEVQTLADSLRAAIPDETAVDVIDELSERLEATADEVDGE